MNIEKTETGYSAYTVKYPVYTVGKTLEELEENILEALNLFFAPQKKTVTEQDLKMMF